MALQENRFRIDDSEGNFWGGYRKIIREIMIPYQWNALNDLIPGASPSHAIENFRIAAGLSTGEFVGMVFQDSDVGKWIEAVAWSLQDHPDPDLEVLVDRTVEIMEKAQAPDGYLNTWFTIREPGKRFTNLLECHELYCAGHLLEGAIAYWRVTGKRRFLEIMLRYVDLMIATFGTGEGQIRGYDGHEEIELALLLLYRVTGDMRHRDLARFFIDERGREPHFFKAEWEARGRISHWTGREAGEPYLAYHQAHQPVRSQTEATGHAVRAVYLYAAMAALARETGDAELATACKTLWEDMTCRQMYVTGGIGSTHAGEAFTCAWDLPNDSAYAETCASVGLLFTSRELLAGPEGHAKHADAAETALYNTVLAGMALDGEHFFYVNPLEVVPLADRRNPGLHHVKTTRQPWFGCACCPPNLARLVMSLGEYAATVRDDGIFLHHFFAGTLELPSLGDGCTMDIVTDYPRDGHIHMTLRGKAGGDVPLHLRIPGWCTGWTLREDDHPLTASLSSAGYAVVPGDWKDGRRLTLELCMEIRILEADPRIRAAAGQACLARGPMEYCLEEADNGPDLSALYLDPRAIREEVTLPGLPEGTVCIRTKGIRKDAAAERGAGAYRTAGSWTSRPVDLTLIPYHLWGNRGEGEMRVWVHLVT